MKLRLVATAGFAAGVLAVVLGSVAEARNPNCSGGILYVTQALAAREKQDMNEGDRLMHRAVDKLSQCAGEDPNDFEAQGYLGWAYAEVDSFRQAGIWFQKAIAGLTVKGDKRKIEWASENRRSFFVRQLNEGIGKIRDAQSLYADLTVPPQSDADRTLMEEAKKNYDIAILRLSNALLLSPGDPSALRNLGFGYMLTGQDSMAEAIYREAIAAAPGDTTILQALRAMRNDKAMKLIEKGSYDEAVTILLALTREEPGNPVRFGGLGDAYFERAQHAKGDSAARPDYKAAGDAYAKASALNPSEHSLAYNAGLAYYNGREYARAEAMFRRAAQAQSDNAQTVSYFGASLAAAKKFDEAAQVFSKLLDAAPKDVTVRRMLVIAYNFADLKARASDQYLVRKALEEGQPAADAAALAAAAGGGQAKIRDAQGVPEEIYQWELRASDQAQNVDTWFYWAKKKAFHFAGGQLLSQSDWSVIDFKSGGGK